MPPVVAPDVPQHGRLDFLGGAVFPKMIYTFTLNTSFPNRGRVHSIWVYHFRLITKCYILFFHIRTSKFDLKLIVFKYSFIFSLKCSKIVLTL